MTKKKSQYALCDNLDFIRGLGAKMDYILTQKNNIKDSQ